MSDAPLLMQAKLTWNDAGVEKEQPVPADGITIGRSSQNSLMITDLAASRFHCKILPDVGGFLLVDLDSTNGTFLNGKRISGSNQLRDGDQIRIGELQFLVIITKVAPPMETLVASKEELSLGETFIVPAQTELPYLVLSSGTGKGTMFTLSKPKIQIGRASRDKQWDIDLVDKSISRPHAEIIREKDEWVLKDLGSANGTTLNGKDVKTPQTLKDGDVVSFGESVLIFRTKGA